MGLPTRSVPLHDLPHGADMRAFPTRQGADGLMEWCRNYMVRTRTPKSARDLVEAWYAHWRGQPDKPEKVKRKFKTHHVDRVAKWLNRQYARGLLAVHEKAGKWGTRVYVTVPLPPLAGSDATHPRKKRLRKAPTRSPESDAETET